MACFSFPFHKWAVPHAVASDLLRGSAHQPLMTADDHERDGQLNSKFWKGKLSLSLQTTWQHLISAQQIGSDDGAALWRVNFRGGA